MPIRKLVRNHTPIQRDAREAVERALAALADVCSADPFVYSALVKRLNAGDTCDPRTIATMLQRLTELVHEMQERNARAVAAIGGAS